jgi:hypothetical protein
LGAAFDFAVDPDADAAAVVPVSGPPTEWDGSFAVDDAEFVEEDVAD